MTLVLVQVGDFDLFDVIVAEDNVLLQAQIHHRYGRLIDSTVVEEEREHLFNIRYELMDAVAEFAEEAPGVYHLNAPNAWPDWYLIIPGHDGTL